MFVIPVPGVFVRHPVTKEILPESGMEVDDNDIYFQRRVRERDLLKGKPVAVAGNVVAIAPVAESSGKAPKVAKAALQSSEGNQ